MNAPTILQGDSRAVIPEILPEWPKIDCLLTDPPYGVAFQSTFGKNKADIEKYQQKIHDDGDAETAIASFDEVLRACLPFMADVCEIYVFSDWDPQKMIQQFTAMISRASQATVGDPAKQGRPAQRQLGPEDLQRQWQDKMKMSGKAVFPAAQVASPTPSPAPE